MKPWHERRQEGGMTAEERRERIRYAEDDLASRIENYLRQTVTVGSTGLPDAWWLQTLSVSERTGFIEASMRVACLDELGNVKTENLAITIIISAIPGAS